MAVVAFQTRFAVKAVAVRAVLFAAVTEVRIRRELGGAFGEFVGGAVAA